MSTNLTNMSLIAWDQPNDTFNYAQLAQNFVNIDKHDHGANGGAALSASSIPNSSIDNSKIKAGSIDANYALQNRSITRIKIKQGIAPDIVTALPQNLTSADDGYEVYYRNSNNNLWHLKFVYSTTGSRWEAVGGPPLTAYQRNFYRLQNNRPNSTTPDYEAIPQMSITVPPGKYHVIATGRGALTYLSNAVGAVSGLYISINATQPTSDDRAVSMAPPLAAERTNLGASMTVTDEVFANAQNTQIKLWFDGFGCEITGSQRTYIKMSSMVVYPMYLQP